MGISVTTGVSASNRMLASCARGMNYLPGEMLSTAALEVDVK